jgi:hypothetical protein
MAAWIAPAVAAGASLLGSAINKSSQSSANRQNLELAKYQNSWNLQQWERENAYNDPSAQMLRLKHAGLNPNLVYGSGTQTQAAHSPKAANMEVVPYLGSSQDLSAAVQSAISAQNQYRQDQLAKSQVDYMRAQTGTEFIKQAGMAVQNSKSSLDYSIAKELQRVSISAAEANLSKIQSEASQAHSSAQMAQFENDVFKPLQAQLTRAQVDQIRTATEHVVQTKDFEKFEQDMKRMGIYPQDKIYVRILSRLIKMFFPNFKF